MYRRKKGNFEAMLFTGSEECLTELVACFGYEHVQDIQYMVDPPTLIVTMEDRQRAPLPPGVWIFRGRHPGTFRCMGYDAFMEEFEETP